MRLLNKKSLALLSTLLICSKSWAIAGIGFIDLFPTFRIASRNFAVEPIDRLYYQQYLQQPKAVVAGIDYSIAGWRLYLAGDIFTNLESDSKNTVFSNLPFTPQGLSGAINNNGPSESFIEYQNDTVELSIGRRKWALGYGEYSFVASADNPYFDGLWFGLYPKAGRGRIFYYFNLASDDNSALNHYFNTQPGDESPFNKYSQKTKYFASHKIGYQWEKFRFSITEAAVIYGTPLTFFNANPLMFWHNTYDNGLNVSLSIAAEGLIGTSLRLHGEVIVDDSGIFVNDAKANPAAIGFQLGLDWQIIKGNPEDTFIGPNFNHTKNAIREKSFNTYSPGLKLSFGAIYASTYLYSRNELDPLGKFTFFNGLQLGVGHWSAMENYLGIPYGPDTILIKINSRYEEQRWLFEGSLGFLIQGEKGALATGFYPFWQNYSEYQGLFNGGQTDDWALSKVENYMILLEGKAYYAIKPYIAAYVGLNSRLVVNHFSRSRVSFESGIGMHF